MLLEMTVGVQSARAVMLRLGCVRVCVCVPACVVTAWRSRCRDVDVLAPSSRRSDYKLVAPPPGPLDSGHAVVANVSATPGTVSALVENFIDVQIPTVAFQCFDAVGWAAGRASGL